MAKLRDWMPSTIQGRIDMGRNWVNILKVRGTAWGVPPSAVGELEDFVVSAEEAQAEALSPGSDSAVRHRRDRFVAEMVAYMRDVRNRFFFIPPMNEENLLQLGLPLPDTVRTQHINVTEEVDFVLEIQGIRQVHIRFWVKGQSNTAKPAGYDGAVIDWGIRDTPPAEPEDLTSHTMASRTPHTIQLTEEERGKTNSWSFAKGKTPKLSGVAG
jgi:hypothetical protein